MYKFLDDKELIQPDQKPEKIIINNTQTRNQAKKNQEKHKKTKINPAEIKKQESSKNEANIDKSLERSISENNISQEKKALLPLSKKSFQNNYKQMSIDSYLNQSLLELNKTYQTINENIYTIGKEICREKENEDLFMEGYDEENPNCDTYCQLDIEDKFQDLLEKNRYKQETRRINSAISLIKFHI